MAYSSYIPAQDYLQFGITDASDAQVAAASRLVDSYLGRPEGLLWMPDANGMPAFMSHLSPTLSYSLPTAITAGQNVSISIPAATFGYQTVGEVVVIDKHSTSVCEACIITAASGNTITLANVQFNHSIKATLDFGLTLLHETTIRPDDYMVRLSRAPVANILAGFSRLNIGRRPRLITDSNFSFSSELLTTPTLSVAPTWTQFDLTQCDLNYATGLLWLDVRIRYVAGWSAANLPWGLKQAVANIVRTAIDNSDFSGNMKLLKAGDSTMERFDSNAFGDDTAALLQPFKTMRIG